MSICQSEWEEEFYRKRFTYLTQIAINRSKLLVFQWVRFFYFDWCATIFF